jgi:hypothetical protein
MTTALLSATMNLAIAKALLAKGASPNLGVPLLSYIFLVRATACDL